MLYEGGVHVPYIFRWTGKIAPGGTCQTTINSVDLYPTLLDVVGTRKPDGYALDGHSYAPLLTAPGMQTTDREPIFWHFPGYLGSGGGTWRTKPAGAIRWGDWKLLEFFEDERIELYNLRDDPGEKHDLAAKMPDKADQVHAKLLAWRKSVAAPMPVPNANRQQPAKGLKEKGVRPKRARAKLQADRAKSGADDS